MLGVSQKFSNSSSSGPSGRPEAGASRRGGEVVSGGARPDPEQMKKLLSGPEGQALLRLLQADGGAGLRAAAEAMKRGNVEGVKEALTPLLAGTEAEELTRRMEEKL